MKKRKKKELTLAEIQARGLDALARELGPDGLIRFFQIYGLGKGNYTRERQKWLDEASVDDIALRIGIRGRAS